MRKPISRVKRLVVLGALGGAVVAGALAMAEPAMAYGPTPIPPIVADTTPQPLPAIVAQGPGYPIPPLVADQTPIPIPA
jgi:hypothetical protein